MPGIQYAATSYMQGLQVAKTLGDIEDVLQAFSAAAGFRLCCLRAVVRTDSGRAQRLSMGQLPDGWIERYRERNYRAIDPAVAHASAHATPQLLSQLTDAKDHHELLEEFLADTRRFGIDEGLTIPLSHPLLWGYLNLFAPAARKHCEDAALIAFMFAAHLTEAIVRVLTDYRQPAYRRLSRREREVLYWAACGKTAWETGEILGITERTVVAHLSRASTVLGCHSKTQAVAVASQHMYRDIYLGSQDMDK